MSAAVSAVRWPLVVLVGCALTVGTWQGLSREMPFGPSRVVAPDGGDRGGGVAAGLADAGWESPRDGGGTDDGSLEAGGLAHVRAAAARTAGVENARFAIRLDHPSLGVAPPLLRIEGRVDGEQGRLAMTMWQWPDIDIPVDVVADGNSVFVRSGSVGEVVGTGDNWLKMVNDDTAGTGAASGSGYPSVVTGLLVLLEAAEEVTSEGERVSDDLRVGWWRVRVGPPDDTRSRSDAEVSAGVNAGGFVDIDPWIQVGIDDDGLVRVVEAPLVSSSLVLRWDLVALGDAGAINLPVDAVDVSGTPVAGVGGVGGVPEATGSRRSPG